MLMQQRNDARDTLEALVTNDTNNLSAFLRTPLAKCLEQEKTRKKNESLIKQCLEKFKSPVASLTKKEVADFLGKLGDDSQKNYIKTLQEHDETLTKVALQDKVEQEKNELEALVQSEVTDKLNEFQKNLGSDEDVSILNLLQEGTVYISEEPENLNFFHDLVQEVSTQIGETAPSEAELVAATDFLVKNYDKPIFQTSLTEALKAKGIVQDSKPVFCDEVYKLKSAGTPPSPTPGPATSGGSFAPPPSPLSSGGLSSSSSPSSRHGCCDRRHVGQVK